MLGANIVNIPRFANSFRYEQTTTLVKMTSPKIQKINARYFRYKFIARKN